MFSGNCEEKGEGQQILWFYVCSFHRYKLKKNIEIRLAYKKCEISMRQCSWRGRNSIRNEMFSILA